MVYNYDSWLKFRLLLEKKARRIDVSLSIDIFVSVHDTAGALYPFFFFKLEASGVLLEPSRQGL